MDPTQAQTISMRRAQWRQRLAEGRKKQATDESRAKLMALGVEPEGVMRISTIKVKAGQLAEIVYQFRENIVPSYTDTGFRRVYLLVDEKAETAKAVTIWNDVDSMNRNNSTTKYIETMELLKEQIEAPPEVEVYSIYSEVEKKSDRD
eukprot:TRINITY_DN46522_c0_g1_i12.p1 TRINITY_DN46522_c0_g1~~TRINITY_DN46522_c0_g1_i12.p1  ORF type:complete len:148 (+),score=22.01 TRINITY_DN46522_c0_g1_i12:92-535(+)